MSRRWLAAGVLAAALSAGGCGVPLDDGPRPVEGGPDLYRSGPPASGAPGPVAERLCLVRDGRLVRVLRRVEAAPSEQELLRDLLAGPTAAEVADGLSSALTGTTTTATVALAGGRATVEVGGRSAAGARSDEVLAFGQIVCTLGTRPEVGTVSFTAGGEPLRVPRSDGSLAEGPLTVADYADLIAS
ncbi:GerMN domain-containing protein [Spirilliplanes yamanashiensis]|uniref:GerMN domain-containing protein n=1 Tax=Spirilliplanes yamanashiensis TaxID=42233 RepID=A0A8J3Y6N9_9ACTN|nr:GerMN domain-containing protein [Spirilliplanes yamanashiensis]MDP9817491.1 hypothetical protein [Spirilliplanes yamanashiensis]GIJ02856.1 hypothetical protein Sya03_22080 [Spirilliplanes yamanashiensis]